MVNHITPEELHDLDMLMYLQHTAGISTTFEQAIEGWRGLSEPAREHIRATFSSMLFIKVGYQELGGTNDVSGQDSSQES